MGKAKFSEITIEGARTNNLKDVNLSLPINKITCIHGPSGSGKTSLAFGTLVDESKRRYLNSLPNDIKFLWNIPPSADVDRIEPILPVWALAQINPVVGSRPVVSDLLGITELISRHFSLYGNVSCGGCGGKITKIKLEELVLKWTKSLKADDVVHFLVKKGDYQNISPEGFPVRGSKSLRSNIVEFEDELEYWEVTRAKVKSIKASVKRVLEFVASNKIEIFLKRSGSKAFNSFIDTGSFCEDCGTGFHSGEFSSDKFNPLVDSGACLSCDGFGQKLEYDLSKIVKNETLTLDEGAIPLLTYKQFSHLMGDFK